MSNKFLLGPLRRPLWPKLPYFGGRWSSRRREQRRAFPYRLNLKSNRETSMVSLTKRNLLIEIRKNNKPLVQFTATGSHNTKPILSPNNRAFCSVWFLLVVLRSWPREFLLLPALYLCRLLIIILERFVGESYRGDNICGSRTFTTKSLFVRILQPGLRFMVTFLLFMDDPGSRNFIIQVEYF